MHELIEIFKGFLTPVIGVVAVYIAYQQYRTNRLREHRESRKAKLDVYKKVKLFLHDVDYSGTVLKDGYEEFKDAIAEADFVFPQDITDWLSDLYSIADEWLNQKEWILECVKESGLTRTEFETKHANDDSWKKTKQEMESYIDKLQTAHCNLKQMFSKYIELK